ncbi:MAG: conjugal transfer protein TraF [Chlorobium sp.]
MKKMLALVSFALSVPIVAKGVEFQTPGAVGMGGAGVARNNGSLTSYWNPAGGAFNVAPFALSAGIGAGVKASDGLAENVDRFSNINFTNVQSFNTTTSTADNVGDVVKTLSIINDIDARKGNMAVTGFAPISMTSKRFSFGLFGTMEGYVQPTADILNVLPNNSVTAVAIRTADLSNALGGTPYTDPNYFSATDRTTLITAIKASDATLTLIQATTLADAIGTKLLTSGIPATTVLSTMTDIALPALAGGGTTTLDKNTTSVLTKAVQYIEVPISYGHPVNVGSKGKLGLGITGKIISGTVYQNQVLLVNRTGNNLTAQDLLNDITQNKKSSMTFGIDLGALYKYNKAVTIGIVGKNLNSPKLAAPDYFVPAANDPVPAHAISTPGTEVELKPQIRAGIAVEPVTWMTFAADLDLKENDTVAPGSVVGSAQKSRNFGGGFEFKPASWLKLRGGAYKNLAASAGGNVLTAGFKLFLLDVDGAFATDSFTMNVNGTDQQIPKEVRVSAGMSFSF